MDVYKAESYIYFDNLNTYVLIVTILIFKAHFLKEHSYGQSKKTFQLTY